MKCWNAEYGFAVVRLKLKLTSAHSGAGPCTSADLSSIQKRERPRSLHHFDCPIGIKTCNVKGRETVEHRSPICLLS